MSRKQRNQGLRPPQRWNLSYRYYVGDVVWAQVPYSGDDPHHSNRDCRPVVLVEAPVTPFESWKVVTLTTKKGSGRPRVRATERNGLQRNGFIWSQELAFLPNGSLRQPLGIVDPVMAETVVGTCQVDPDQRRVLRLAALQSVRWVA